METNEAPKRKRLNPEIAGILGILGVIILIAFVMCAVNGKFEQWFGWTVFTGPKAYDSVVLAETDGKKDKLVVLDVEKSTRTTILTDTEISEISVSPTGSKIAFISPVDDINQVFTIGPTGKKLKQLTYEGNSKSKPGFSPDGVYVTYISKGKLYKSDLNGGNTRDIIPTRQQLQQFVNERGERLSCKDYVWNAQNDGMLAVVNKGEHLDRFVLVMNGGDAHELPFPDGMYMDIDALCSSHDGTFYIATGRMFEKNDLNKQTIYTVFAVQVPKEHSHSGEGAEGGDLSFAPIYQINKPISNAVLPLNGMTILLSIKGDGALEGLVEINPEDQKIESIVPDIYDKLDSPAFANALFCQSDSTLDFLDFETTVKSTLSEKCKCFALSRRTRSKEMIHGGPVDDDED